jgi:photosystem II stability/assembly factor-like uncharacterized protein
MDELEQDLRRALRDPARAVVADHDPVASVRAGMHRRRRDRAIVGSAATVTAVVAAVALLVLPSAGGPRGMVADPTPPAAPTTGPSPVAPAAVPSEGPVPAGFTATDLSFVSVTRGWALGTAPCTTAPCTSLLRTDDGGATWSGGPAPKAYLRDGSTDCAKLPCVTGIRFADGLHGYSYGGALFTTADGGTTWTREAAPYVEALEHSGDDALRVVRTSNGCPPGCPYAVERAPVGSTSWVRASTPALLGNAAHLLRQGDDAYLFLAKNPAGGAPDAHPQVVVSHDRGRTWTGRPDPCGPVGQDDPAETDAADAATAPDGTLVVLCRARAAGGPATLRVSTDRGATFGPALALPAGTAAYAVAAASLDHLVVRTSRGSVAELVRTGDGGRTFTTVVRTAEADAPSRGFLAFTTADVGTWNDPRGALVWRTMDAGASWTPYAYR